MIDTKALRSRILDLAIQGKLTEQLPSDGTAEELYQQIQAEKQRLIKERKIKKEKPLPEISEDEISFEIPENWKWVRWGNLSESIQYGYNAPAKESGRIRMVRITDIQNNSVQWQNVPFCDIEETAINDYLLQNGDILFARTGGTVGKSFIVTNISEESVYAGYLIRTRYSSNLSGEYLKFFMGSKLYWKQLQVGTTATAQPNCNGKTLSKMILPLPPLAEQKRIVSRVEEIFHILDTIDTAQQQYSADTESLKAKLITAGIQGKLTEQLDSDGTAEELYQQIQAEKQRLIKEGKIKKEKPLPEIKPEEVPFEIPENWMWVRLGEIFTLQAGKFISASQISDKQDSEHQYKCFGGNGIRGYVSAFNTNGTHALIGRQGALCGNVNLAHDIFYATEHAVVVYQYCNTDVNWIFYGLTELNLNQYATSVAQPGLAVSKIEKVLIPLLPLAEQKRIADKLDEVLGAIG